MKRTRSVMASVLFWTVPAMLPLAPSGCASGGSSGAVEAAAAQDVSEEAGEAFVAWVTDVTEDIKGDPDYKRIPLDTKDQIEWFESLMFMAWDKRITADQFVEEGLKKYPDYRESLEFVAARLP